MIFSNWDCIDSEFFLAGAGSPRTFGQLREGKSRLAKPTFAFGTYFLNLVHKYLSSFKFLYSKITVYLVRIHLPFDLKLINLVFSMVDYIITQLVILLWHNYYLLKQLLWTWYLIISSFPWWIVRSIQRCIAFGKETFWHS